MSLRTLIDDLAAAGHLLRIDDEVDPRLEAAEIQRRVYAAGGPAVYFANLKGCAFPAVSNLFGTIERARYLFRKTYDAVRRAIELKIEPQAALRNPLRYASAPLTAWRMRPKLVAGGPVLRNETTLRSLPQIVSWSDDGGPFITLPQVYSEDPARPGWEKSNLGMYRVQLGGNLYEPDREIGLHYQIHRGIGVHHTEALRRGEPFRVNIFVGGHPAMTLAAVMPLPEGPFGDHLGYYSLTHDFPVLRVDKVYHRDGAVWPFTVVGRPPQEDTVFGQLIHELTGPVIPTVLPGIKEVHAVDASGVHPLLVAIGCERYMPFHENPRPQELLTQANAILGQGQMSLAKYVWIANAGDNPQLETHDLVAFFRHMLERVDWRRDLHFQTCTTIDTLDYSGDGFNQGSKLVIAAVGKPVRELATELPSELRLPEGFAAPRIALPGALVVQSTGGSIAEFCATWAKANRDDTSQKLPLIVVADDSEFTAKTLNNFLWVTFTRSNPAADIDGVGAFTEQKHWGCRGPLVIDARRKPRHAPPLVEDPEITRRVDARAARGGPLAKFL